MAASTASAGKRALLGALRALLRPLVRQLISRGVTYPAFSRLAKEVYIEIGTKHFTLDFKKQTDSRVALVTGITRKEIGQTRRGQVPAPSAALDLEHTLPARVVSRWLAAPPYVDETGRPRLLPYEAARRVASFVTLVAELGGDIPPRAVLDELLRVGAARLTPRGGVQLTEQAYTPAGGAEEPLAILGIDVAELVEAVVRSMEQPRAEDFLQQVARADDLVPGAMPVLRAELRNLSTDFIQAVNRALNAASRHRLPGAAGEARRRAVVTVYCFDHDMQ